jgi:beta-N-acetylhexosaminidase
VVAAGCDAALHCSGKMEEMIAVAATVPQMSADGVVRLERAMATVMVEDEGPDMAEALAKRDALLALV